MSSLLQGLKQIGRYPSAIVGLLIIIGLIVLAGYTVVTIPYSKAIELWRADENTWAELPRNAAPKWLNRLTGQNLPETIVIGTQKQPELKVKTDVEGITMVNIELPFTYNYNAFPTDVGVFYTSTSEGERPFVMAYWETPDGRRIELEAQSLEPVRRSYLSLDPNLIRHFGSVPVEQGLFMDPAAPTPQVLKGQYKLVLEGYLFDAISDFDAKLVVYGKVHGWAGTDHRRRDLSVALLWGTPLALAFGLLAALGSTITTFVISAVGVWYGKWLDGLIQRITEVNMTLPLLPILIMVGTFYSRSIWVILVVVILLGIFGGGIKTYRSIFLQIKNAPYIEAARSYGASNRRLIFRYLIPRMIPVLIPTFVTLIPSYVFLESTLAVLGLGDPVLPTWGKLLQDASENGAMYKGYYYWVLQPAALLMLTGLGFAMVGFALDRIFNPRLRGR